MIEPEIEEFPLALECSNGRQPSGGLHIKVHYVSSQKKEFNSRLSYKFSSSDTLLVTYIFSR